MNAREWVVVVPSNREVSSERLRAIPDEVEVLVVDIDETSRRLQRWSTLCLS